MNSKKAKALRRELGGAKVKEHYLTAKAYRLSKKVYLKERAK